ncbi:MAG: dihydropteroate synthase [Flavobacteriales bacterium]|nr:dihydropteroate synthase [Flavobacteriales bacterium]
MAINCKGKLLDLDSPKIMGILNVTSDSFYDGGLYTSSKNILKRVEQMILEGVDIIDVGGQSTRPNADFINAEDELKKVIPVIKEIKKEFSETILSVDTFWSKVAEESVNEGVAIINDVSGGSIDDKMFSTVEKLKVPYILMHSRGTPGTMQNLTEYNDVTNDINSYFLHKIKILREKNIHDIILDPGFGFAKSISQNYELLNNVGLIGFQNFPILAGISRKSMMYKILEESPDNILCETTALNLQLLLKKVNILRVHDVKKAKNILELSRLIER